MTQLIHSHESGQTIAFGMQWQVIVAANGRSEAQKIAKAAKATHYVFTSRQVGFCTIPSDTKSKSIVSAALIAATTTRSGVFGIKLTNDTYWFAVIHAGQPKYDEVLVFASEPDAVRKINELVCNPEFNQQTVPIYTNINGNDALSESVDYSVQSFFNVPPDGLQPLRPLSKFSGNQGSNKSKMLILIAAALLLVIKFGSDYYVEYKARQYAADHPIITEPELTPEQAWKPVWDTFQKETPKPNNNALAILRATISNVPVIWAGWSLTGVVCVSPDTLQGSNRPWNCTSSYDRNQVGLTSIEMLGKVKGRLPNASVLFPTSVSMDVKWSVSNEEQPIAIGDFINIADDPVRIISALQVYFPALTKRPELKMQPFELQPPKNKDGKPYPKPDSIPSLYKGEIAIAGPLRTLDALDTLTNPANVQWLSVSLKPGLNTAPDQKGIRSSSFTVEALGRVWGIAAVNLTTKPQ